MKDRLLSAIEKVRSHIPPHMRECDALFTQIGKARDKCDCGMDDLIASALEAQRRAAKLERILVKYAKAAWVKPEDVRLSRFQSYTHPIIKEYIAIQKRKKGGKS